MIQRYSLLISTLQHSTPDLIQWSIVNLGLLIIAPKLDLENKSHLKNNYTLRKSNSMLWRSNSSKSDPTATTLAIGANLKSKHLGNLSPHPPILTRSTCLKKIVQSKSWKEWASLSVLLHCHQKGSHRPSKKAHLHLKNIPTSKTTHRRTSLFLVVIVNWACKSNKRSMLK